MAHAGPIRDGWEVTWYRPGCWGAVLRGWGGPWGEQFAPGSFCILKALISSWPPLTALYVSSGLSFPSVAHNDQREKFDLSPSLVSLWCQASPAPTGIEGGGGAGPTLYPLVEGSSTGGLKLGDTGHVTWPL